MNVFQLWGRKMSIVKQNGKVEWVDEQNIHRLTPAEARAFLLFSKAEQDRHREDIIAIEQTIMLVEAHLKDKGSEK